jgi:ATP-binding cassette subfamily B protein
MPLLKTGLAIIFLLVQTGCALYLPYLTAGIIDKGVVAGDVGAIWRKGGLMLGFTTLSLIGALLNMYISGNISFSLGANLREEIYTKVLSFSKAEYDKFGTSGLITRNTNDVTQVQSFVDMVLKFMILSPLYLIGGIYLTWRLNKTLAIPFMVAIPFMTIATIIIYRFATPLYSKIQNMLDKLNLLFREGITGVRVIRAFSKENEDYQKYENANHEFTKTSIAAGTIMSMFLPLITLIINMATIGILWIGGHRVTTGNIEVGSIMAAISYSMQILMGFALLTNVILTLPRGQVSAIRISEVLDTPLSIEDNSNPQMPHAISLQFDNVDFCYPGASKQTLSGMSFAVEANKTLAIIGSTGDGKTSILGLIPRLYDVNKGSVKIGGVDVRQIEQSKLRNLISYAPQKSALMMGTIRSNMKIAKQNLGDEEIWSVLDAANASEFVRNLPEGLDSTVEKGGANFSGGQKQRLCIARTLLKNADIYLFDDSFSALDFKTDAAVRSAINTRLAGKITIIVAQRINTIVDADIIAVLDKGRIAGIGTHQELLQSNAVYQEIVHSQGYEEVVA